MSFIGQGGLAAKLEPINARLWDAVTAVTQVKREDLDTCEDAKNRLVQVCTDLEAQLKGNAAAQLPLMTNSYK
jgi:hypothetical protein